MGLGEEDSRHPEAIELENSEEATESPGMDEIISTGHRSRYNLRSRQVNSATLGHFENVPNFKIETKKKPQVSSILKKFSGYTYLNNFLMSRFRLQDKELFKSTKKALFFHNLNCNQTNCRICDFYEVTKKCLYVSNDVAKYNEGHHFTGDTEILDYIKRVQFSVEGDSRHERKTKTVSCQLYINQTWKLKLKCNLD